MEWYPLDGRDGLISNMFHHLWRKNSSGMSCPNVSFPDTVIFRLNRPLVWCVCAGGSTRTLPRLGGQGGGMWQRGCGPRVPCVDVRCCVWWVGRYFTSRSGELLRKNKVNLTNEGIMRSFSSRSKASCEVVAVFISSSPDRTLLVLRRDCVSLELLTDSKWACCVCVCVCTRVLYQHGTKGDQ